MKEPKISRQVLNRIVRQLSKGHEDDIRVGFLTGRVKGSEVISIDGANVPRQKSSGVMSVVSPKAALRTAKTIKSSRKRVVGIVNYNAKFATFASATNEQALRDLTASPKIGLVVNVKGEHMFFD